MAAYNQDKADKFITSYKALSNSKSCIYKVQKVLCITSTCVKCNIK